MSGNTEPRVGRRSVLGGVAAAAGAAGLAAGPWAGTAAGAGRRQDDGRFADKVVAITGATSGIGRAAALRFAEQGARVAFCGRREREGRQVEDEIRRAGGDATFIRADVRVPDQVQAFVDGTVRRYGRLDIAFNNAGVNRFIPITEMTVEQWDDMLLTNTRGVFLAVKAQIPHMLRNRGPQRGIIVITGSVAQVATRPGGAAYAASKRGVMGVAQAATLDHAKDGIRVNVLAPGTTETAMVRPPGLPDDVWAREKAAWEQANVDGLRRMASPEEMAAAALTLADPLNTYMTGATVLVDGGMTAGL